MLRCLWVGRGHINKTVRLHGAVWGPLGWSRIKPHNSRSGNCFAAKHNQNDCLSTHKPMPPSERLCSSSLARNQMSSAAAPCLRTDTSEQQHALELKVSELYQDLAEFDAPDREEMLMLLRDKHTRYLQARVCAVHSSHPPALCAHSDTTPCSAHIPHCLVRPAAAVACWASTDSSLQCWLLRQAVLSGESCLARANRCTNDSALTHVPACTLTHVPAHTPAADRAGWGSCLGLL